jgi:hypothetical protein
MLNKKSLVNVRLLFNLIIFIVICSNLLLSASAENDDKKANEDAEDQDYFYDADLKQEDIKKIQEEKKKEELLRKSRETTTLAREPDFFTVKANKDQEIDWNKFYMQKMIEEHMKKYQEEQLELRRKKFENDLNHPMLSIITLTSFFGISSIIGLIVVFVRGKQFRKKENNNSEKKIYKPVLQNETV